jgi:hypothetical protein
MAKRDWPLRFKCAHEGCDEHVTYRYDTLRDLKSSFELKHYGEKGWRCVRHSRPDEVLSAENVETRIEIVNREESHGRYFGSSGFVSGPGFKVFAKDFPPGTKLIVTARVELPDAASIERSSDRGNGE